MGYPAPTPSLAYSGIFASIATASVTLSPVTPILGVLCCGYMMLNLDGATWLVFGAWMALGLLIYYFVGIDEGPTSVFGNTMVVHEFVHDARHFLGFPCH